jgi:transcriptional regulator with XRE-family HTH domain
MAKDSKSAEALPGAVRRSLKALGQDISVARRRRRLSQRLMAEKMLVNVETLQRLEKGDPKVGLGIVASALLVLGMTRRLEQLAAPADDTVGQGETIRALGKRARPPRPDPDLDF